MTKTLEQRIEIIEMKLNDFQTLMNMSTTALEELVEQAEKQKTVSDKIGDTLLEQTNFNRIVIEALKLT